MLTDAVSDSAHKRGSGDNAFDTSPSEKETAKEAPGHASHQMRLSVRDLASKFDKGKATVRAATAKGKLKDSTLYDRDAQFDKLTWVLNDLRGRVSGRSKEDVEEAFNAIKALIAICARQEAELAQERGEMKRLSRLFKQYSGDAKNIIEEAHAVTQREIGTMKEIAVKMQNALHEHKQIWAVTGKDLEELKRESHEARRIKMLHESSKVQEVKSVNFQMTKLIDCPMDKSKPFIDNSRVLTLTCPQTVDMEHQINGLRQQLVDKGVETAMLRKELETFKLLQQEGGRLQWYRLSGLEQLGTTLTIEPLDDTVCDLSRCSIQWYRISPDGTAMDIISGAIRPQYAPEPFDVGRRLRAEIIVPCGKTVGGQTGGPIDPAPGLENYVEILVNKGGAQFNVRIVLKNGEMVKKQSLHTLDVNKTRIKLQNAHMVKAKEIYSSSMQLCGARGGGDSAAQGLFWVAVKGVTFMLVLESERERNAAILLARRFAKLNKIFLGGPDDVVPLEA